MLMFTMGMGVGLGMEVGKKAEIVDTYLKKLKK
jgi:hypothetical protein